MLLRKKINRLLHKSHLEVLLILSVVLFPGCGNQESKTETQPTLTPQRIILIGIDTLRADHLSCYGYPIKTSPAIDKFAQGATLFEQSISQSSWTLPSFASMFTGVYSFEHKAGLPCREGVRTPENGFPVTILDDTYPTLAEMLRQQGYQTTAFTEGCLVSPPFGLARGFNLFEICSIPQKKQDSISGKQVFYKDIKNVVDASLGWIKENRQDNFFLFMHTYQPHRPLKDPLEVLPKIKNAYARNGFFEAIQGYVDASIKLEFSKKEPVKKVSREKLYDWVCMETMLYDCEIRYTDYHMGRFFDSLKKMGLYDDSLIIFTSDHGCEFAEHGGMYHGNTLFQESIFVPMIIKKPNQKRGSRVNDCIAEGVDILPTVLDICSIRPDKLEISGTNLFGKNNITIARSHLFKKGGNFAAGIQNMVKMIYNYDSPEDILLFQLAGDPGEKINVGPQFDEVSVPTFILPAAKPKADESLCFEVKDKTAELRNRLKTLGYIQ
jgi:arylsulfatase A-like enzyme